MQMLQGYFSEDRLLIPTASFFTNMIAPRYSVFLCIHVYVQACVHM